MAGINDLMGFFGLGTQTVTPRAPVAPRPKTYAEMSEAERQAQRDQENAKSWLQGIDTSTYGGQFPTHVGGYRADPTGKYGGKHGLETMPTNLPAAELYAKVRAMQVGQQYGVPQLSPEQLAALALKEGNGISGVFGVDPVWDKTNPNIAQAITKYDPKMKGDKELYNKMIATGVNPGAAAFAVRLANKNKVARRLGIPLASAWVGTGHSGYESSNQYATNLQQFEAAAAHKRNKALVDFIRNAATPPKPKKKAEGGIVVDHGNPAKRERLI